MKKLLAVLLILGLAAAPAMAAEVTISGSTVVQYTWTSITSAEDANGDTTNDFGGYSSNKGPQKNGVLSYPKNGKSTGFKLGWKASDTLSGVVNIAQGHLVGPGPDASQENAFFKDTYAKWDFGAGAMRFGYFGGSATNFVAFATGKDDDPWIFAGSFVMDRSAGMGFDFGGFTLEFKENFGQGITDSVTGDAYSDVDTLIPQIQLAYTYASKMFFVKASGVFQTWTVEDTVNEESMAITTLAAALAGRVNLGPAYISLGGWYTSNGSNADTWFLTWGKGGPMIVDGEVKNYTVMNMALGAGVQISPKLGINAGICYNSGAYDDGNHTDFATNAFLNLKTNIGPIMFSPEIGYNDNGESAGRALDKTLYVTAQFKVFW